MRKTVLVAAFAALISAGHDGWAVVPGASATAAEFPAVGALLVFDGQAPRLVCTGTLIASDVVVTAAHCLRPLRDRLPSFTLNGSIDKLRAGDLHAASRLVLHPGFNVQAAGAMHDVALVFLVKPVGGVRPARVLSESQGRQLSAGQAVELVGYGRMSLASDVRGRKNHGASSLSAIRAQELVVGTAGPAQNCEGDSGGPAFLLVRGRQVLVGVASRSVDEKGACATGSIHARLDTEAAWIAAVLAAGRRARQPGSTRFRRPSM